MQKTEMSTKKDLPITYTDYLFKLHILLSPVTLKIEVVSYFVMCYSGH